MPRPQFSLKALLIFALFAALPSACIYQFREFRRAVDPFERVLGREIRGGSDGKMELLGRRGVQYLFLGRSDLDDAQLASLRPHLETLPRLRALNLSSTRITDQGLASLEGLSHLEHLMLEHNALSAPAVDRLQQKLPGCVFHYHPLTVDQVAAIQRIRQLGGSVMLVELGSQVGVDVDLAGAPIGDGDLPAIVTAVQSLPTVRTLSIKSTKVTAAGVAQLRQAFPGTEVLP
ncbi:MAG: hypothetical protein U0836_18695 [Pirellulales bacterium]